MKLTALLHYRPDAPGDEFLVAQTLRTRVAAGGDFQHQVENPAADLLYRAFGVGDSACIDVHVVSHAAVGVAIGGDLDYRNGWETDGAATAGGEGDQVAAAGGQARERYRVITRSVHEGEAGGGDAFGVIVN